MTPFCDGVLGNVFLGCDKPNPLFPKDGRVGDNRLYRLHHPNA